MYHIEININQRWVWVLKTNDRSTAWAAFNRRIKSEDKAPCRLRIKR